MRKRDIRAEWVIAGSKHGELAHCTRCGHGLTLNCGGNGVPIPIYVAAADAFIKMHSACEDTGMSAEQVDTRLSWFYGRDTGTSSLTIYHVFTGRQTPHERYDPPQDPSDFGRCYRLLKLYPEWIPRLGEVSDKFPQWKPLVEHWPELTALYEQELPLGMAPKLYARIKELLA